MTATVVGAALGAVLAAAALFFGFWGFLLTAVFIAVGALVGRFASGELDLRAVANVFSGRRTS